MPGGIDFSSKPEPPPSANERAPELPQQMVLFVVRHGESEWNQARAENNFFAMAGSYDHPLNSTGLQQAKVLASSWPSSEVAGAMKRARVYSSPLTRAVQTAMMGFAAHPRVEGEGVCLVRAAREVKHSVLNLDSVGIAVSGGVHARACDEAARHLAPEDLELLQRTKLQAAEAQEKWWTSNYDTQEEIDLRVAELFARIRSDVAAATDENSWSLASGTEPDPELPAAIIVAHSIFIREMVRRCTVAGTPFSETDLAAELTEGKLCNAGSIQLTVRFLPPKAQDVRSGAINCPCNRTKFLDCLT